jgi:hypothetical protein
MRHIVICGLCGSTIFFHINLSITPGKFLNVLLEKDGEDHVRNEVLLKVKEQRNILHKIRKRKANWIGHILHRNCLLQLVIEGIKGGIEVIGGRGRRSRKLLDLLNHAVVLWGQCDPSPLAALLLFKLSRILTSPFTYFFVSPS